MASFLEIRKKYTEEKKTETGTDKQTGGGSTDNTESGKGGAEQQRGFYTPDPTKPISPTAPASNQVRYEFPTPWGNKGGVDIPSTAGQRFAADVTTASNQVRYEFPTPWGNKGGVDIPSTAGQRFAADVTTAVNTAQELEAAKADPKTAYEQAQKEYDAYVNSDEYKAKRNQNYAVYASYLQQVPGISTFPVAAAQQQQQQQQQQYKIEEDETEKQLRAKRDYYQQLANMKETQQIMEADLAEFEKWPEEDRIKLRTWIFYGAGSLNSMIGAINGETTREAYMAKKELEEKYGADVVDRMARSVSRSENEKFAEEMVALGKQTGDEYEWMGSTATIPMNLIGSISGPLGYLGEFVRGGKGQYPTLDPNNLGNMPNVYSGAVRGQVAQNIAGDVYDENGVLIKDGGIIRKVLSIGYQGVMSAADSMTRAIVAGPAAPVLAATGAFSQAVGEASKQGATPTQAIIYGVGIAGIEAATEKIPLDEMMKAAKGGMSAAKAIARQALTEATEEEISLFAGLLWEAAVLQGKASYQQKIGEAVANGMGYAEAKAQADKEIWMEALRTAMVSSIAGGISGAATSTYGNATAAQEGTQSQQKPETKTEAQTEGKQETPVQTTAQPVAAQDGEAQAQTPTAQTGIQTAAAPQEQPVAAAPVQTTTPDIQNAVQGVVQGLNQRQQAEAEARAEQARTREAIEQGMAQEYGPMMPQEAPKSQMQQDVDNATAAGLAEQGIGEQAVQAEQEARATQAPTQDLAENQGIKGTGAAEQNFSGKASYQDLLYEGNVQPDREGDVRPMEVPKTDTEGRPVSAVAADVYGSEHTSDDLASAEEEAIARGELSYIEITNNQAAERASRSIENAGSWEVAYEQWHDSVRDGVTGAEMAARGAMLLNHAAEVYEQTKATGNETATREAKRRWLSILMDVRELGTNTAQGLQAMRMIRELSPPDKLDFAAAAVKRMVANMRLQKDVKIDEELMNEYRMAETDEQRDEIMGRIQQNVADQIPSTFLDKWTALRYTNMLGNLKTQVRNIAGNVGSAIAYRLKNQVVALMEDLVKIVNKDYQRTTSHIVGAEYLKFGREDFKLVSAAVNGGGKYSERTAADGEFQQGIMDRRRVFKSNAKNDTVRKIGDVVLAPLEGYRRATNWMMNNQYFGDEAFGRAAYARALAGFLKANGVKNTDLSNVDQKLLDKARAYAIREAQEATFKDNTALANIASNIKKSFGVVGEGIVPFTKTPANVLVRAEEFSPLGFLNTAYKAAQMAAGKSGLTEKNGIVGNFARSGEHVTGADIINSLAKTTTGTVLFALGALMFDRGMLSAGPDDDEDKNALDELTGKQNYAIQFTIDGKRYSYTMDWLTPVSVPMFMGAEFWKALQNADGGATFADYEQVFTAISDPMIQMSMLQGINDSLDGIKYSGNNLGQFMFNAIVSYLTQGLTNTLMGQIERSTEENRTTTYIDENSNVPKWLQREIGKASQKIPGWDYQQMEYRNRFGETEKNEGGLMYNLLSPGYLSAEKNNAVTDELYRANAAGAENVVPTEIPKKVTYTDTDGVKHTDYQLTEEEYQKIAETQGQTAYRIVENLVNSDEYKGLTESQKAYARKAAYEYAQEKGKQAAIPNYYSEASAWISETEETDTKAFIARGARLALDNAIGNAVNAVKNSWNVTPAAKSSMEGAYDGYNNLSPEAQERVLEDADASVVNYIDTRNAGGTTQNYLDAVGNVQKLGDGAHQVDKWGAVAATKGLKPDVADALMKAYMTDYDPDSESPNKTEPKYDYMRHKMGMTTQEYVEAMRVYYEVKDIPAADLEKGEKKKDIYLKRWQDTGLTEAEANELYYLWVSTNSKQTIDVIDWYNNWSGAGNTGSTGTQNDTSDSNVPWYLRYR